MELVLVLLHLLRVLDECFEIFINDLEEIFERLTNAVHLVFDSIDALAKLILDLRLTQVIFFLRCKNLSVCHIIIGSSKMMRVILILNHDVVVGRALVHHLDVYILMAKDFALDRARVAKAGLFTNVFIDLRVLWEHLVHEELPLKRKCLNRGRRNVDKLSLSVADQVVVTEEAICVQMMSDLERLLLEGLLIGVEAYANSALCDEVHLKHLVFLIIDHIRIDIILELTRLEPKGHIV